MPASGGKPETRKKILDATWKLMEAQPNEAVAMSAIAKAAGISRQALYLHFETRTALMLATVKHVDEAKGLNERLRAFEAADSGIALLESCVDIWGNYIPEIYGLACALRNTLDRDEATAAAWRDAMACVRDLCAHTIDALEAEGRLHSDWSHREAVELMWSQISIHSWEQLVLESGFSTAEFVQMTQKILKKTLLIQEPVSKAKSSRTAGRAKVSRKTA